MILFVSIFGLALGAAAGAMRGSLNDVGIDDDFIKQEREYVTQRTSAPFLLSSGAVGKYSEQVT